MVVIAKTGTDQLLNKEGFLVRATRRGNTAQRTLAVFGLNALELVCGEAKRLFPADFLPGILNVFADHRVKDAVLVIGIAIGKATLHTEIAVVECLARRWAGDLDHRVIGFRA